MNISETDNDLAEAAALSRLAIGRFERRLREVGDRELQDLWKSAIATICKELDQLQAAHKAAT